MVSRAVCAGLGIAVMAAGAMALAPPASAVPETVVEGCVAENVVSTGYVRMVYPDGCVGRTGLPYGNFDFGPSTTGTYDSSTLPILSTTSLSGSYIEVWTTTGTCDYTQYVIAPGYEGEVPSPSAVGAGCPGQESPIPAWVQAYGRASQDAACLDGWDASWQEWAVPVTGGWVCTRSIPSLG